ncbi:MAG: hypothetical protein NT124_02645 [Candidatus Dependentiae bacterium]|nr:hypothetical protein [Candidatus Dependentiae bacterium]
MGLLAAWKESLDILRPHNLKLFMLVTLNTFVQGCKVFMRSVIWWFIPLIIAYNYFFNTVVRDLLYSVGDQAFINYVTIVLPMNGVFFLSSLMIHPSVKRKTIGYFFSWRNLIIGLIYFIYTSFICYTLVFRGPFVPTLLHGIIAMIIWMIYSVLFLFFLLDSDISLAAIGQSMVRAAKMVLYNAPAFLLIMILLLISFIALVSLLPYQLFKEITPVPHCALFLGLISAINNIYIKKLHDNKNLYL